MAAVAIPISSRHAFRPKELRLRSHSFADFRSPDRPTHSPRSALRSPAVTAAAALNYLEDGMADEDLYDARFQPWSPRKAHDLSADKRALSADRRVPAKSSERRQQSLSQQDTSLFGDGVVGITGLSNLGNTCFMNSALQCLSATVPFARFLKSGAYKAELNRHNVMGSRGYLARAIAKLLTVMWSQEHSRVSPDAVKEAISRFAPQFEGFEQQDAQELFSFLLDCLHEDLNIVGKKPDISLSEAEEAELEKLSDALGAETEWQRAKQRDSSVVTRLFTGQERSRLICKTCKATSTTWSNFNQLSLAIPTSRMKRSATLVECVQDYLKSERLPKEDGWRCHACKVPRSATKTMAVTRLPPVIILHLNRTQYTSFGLADKDDTPVQFPIDNFDLGSLASIPEQKQKKYELYAMINHVGTAESGHYTSIVKSMDKFYSISDSNVRQVSYQEVKKNYRAVYMLFYRLQA